MDGVPGLSFPGIAAGETFTYSIPIKQRGTYWYHSHKCLDKFDANPGQFAHA
jgi:FtsP/CotA-like multicopper oxidase with cupredoxin domain